MARARAAAAGNAARARGRLGAPVPPRVHLRHDRPAEGRRCTSRAASSSRSRARSRTRRTCTRGDRVHFATDMGWIMGPWTVVGAGALGATVVFAEGAPDWPDDRLWRLVEQERVTMLGVSPTLVRALIPKGEPQTDTSSLRAITTTGEPWNPDPYLWLHEQVGRGRDADREHQRRDRGRRLLPLRLRRVADQAGLARLPGARRGHGRRRPRGTLGARRGRRARLPAAVARDDARRLGRRPSATSRRTGAASPASGRTATGRRSTRTATGTCTAAPTTRSTSRASASGRPSSSRRRSRTRQSRRRPRSACRTR